MMFSKWIFFLPFVKTNEHSILSAYFVSPVSISKPPSVLLRNKLSVFFVSFA
jgi:hypothetical protein